jgi:ribosome maturation factor RimP
MEKSVRKEVWQIVEPLLGAEGLELVDIEYRSEAHGTMLRLFIDRKGGVSLDDLAPLSRRLGDALDVHEAVPGAYTLEVSSPGINRRLRQPDHFRRYVGKRVRVRCSEYHNGRRSFLGPLLAVENDGIVVGLDAGREFIPFDDIAQANYEHEFEPTSSTRGARRSAPR